MNRSARLASTRSLVRSQWDKITFYGKNVKEDKEPTDAEQVAEKPVEPLPNVFDDEEDYFLVGKAFSAVGRLTDKGFLVYGGAIIAPPCKSFKGNKTYSELRSDLVYDGVIDDELPGEACLVGNFLFKSVTQAACIIAGAMLNGRDAWKTAPDKDGAVLTFGEAHPRLRKSKAQKEAARRAREARRAEREERSKKDDYKSGTLVEGRKWNITWRGQTPIHKNGIYSGVRCV